MPTINFSGLASGLDTRAIIDAILEAERRPIERLQARQTLFDQQRSALDELRSKLDSFESALRDLSSSKTFRGRTVSVGDESVLRASAVAGAETGLFDIEVTSLAAAHKVKSAGLAASDEGLVSDGTITIQSGDNEAITVNVSASTLNNSLAAVRDEINDADAGVRASVIHDGSFYRLIVRAEESGVEEALTITDSTNLDLDLGTNRVVAASDAALVVDGIPVTSSSNKVTGVIPGLTLDLLATNEGEPVQVGVAQDLDGVVEATEQIVTRFNELIDYFGAQTDKENPGVLAGNSTLRTVQSRIQSLLTQGVAGIPLGGIRSLSSIGVSFDGQTGRATLDSARLRELLEDRFEEVGDLFLSSGTAESPRVQYVSSTKTTASGSYAVEITQAAERATLLGSTAIATLDADEQLTIGVGAASVVVELRAGFDAQRVIDAINAALETAGVQALATNDAGRLRLTSTSYGSAVELSVLSDRIDPLNGAGSGFTTSEATDTGIDVAGSIGGAAATGSGRLLTGAAGGGYAGLTLQITPTAAEVTAVAGDFGEVSFSRGLIDSLVTEVDELTRFDTGTLDIARSALEANSKRLDDEVASIQDRLAIHEIRLIRTFTAAERAISLLQAQQSQLGSTVSR